MQSDDTQYEFEAPRYVDFTAPDAVEDGDADHWFGMLCYFQYLWTSLALTHNTKDAHDATPTAGTPFKQTELPEFSVDEVTEGPTEDSLTHAESLMEVSEVALTSSINEAQTEVAPITTAAPITRAKKASQMTRPLTVPKEFHFSKSHQEKLLSKVKKSPGAIVVSFRVYN